MRNGLSWVPWPAPPAVKEHEDTVDSADGADEEPVVVVVGACHMLPLMTFGEEEICDNKTKDKLVQYIQE